MRFQPAKFGMKRKTLRSFKSAAWFETQQNRVREETSKIRFSPALPKCTFCSVNVEQAVRALLSLTTPVGKNSQSGSWLIAPPRLWGGQREQAC